MQVEGEWACLTATTSKNGCLCDMQMADLSTIATRHCQSNGFVRNARVLYCGDHFDDEAEFQMEQGLGSSLDRSPVANTCFWIGKIVGNVDSEGEMEVGIDVC